MTFLHALGASSGSTHQCLAARTPLTEPEYGKNPNIPACHRHCHAIEDSSMVIVLERVRVSE